MDNAKLGFHVMLDGTTTTKILPDGTKVTTYSCSTSPTGIDHSRKIIGYEEHKKLEEERRSGKSYFICYPNTN